MTKSSRIPGFYKLSLAERRSRIAEHGGIQLSDIVDALDRGGLNPETADKGVENVFGVYGPPFGIALNVRGDDVDRPVPVGGAGPSGGAAASHAAPGGAGGGGVRR